MMKTALGKNWTIVAGCFLFLAAFMGIVNNSFSFLIIPVTNALNCSRAQFSASQSIIYLFNVIGSLFGWKFYSRYGIVKVMRFTCPLLVLSFFLLSLLNKLTFFYLVSILIGFCMGLSTNVPIALLLKYSFPKRYGFVLGIALMGSGIGGMIFNLLTNAFIQNFGWRSAIQILAVIMAFLTIPVVFFIFREPHHLALDNTDNNKTHMNGYRKNRSIILTAAILFFFSIASVGLTTTSVPYLQDIGYSPFFASVCSSATMAVLAVGKPAEGALIDKYGIISCTYAAFISTIIGLAGLIFFNNVWMILLILIGAFWGCPFSTVATPVLAIKSKANDVDREAVVGLYNAMIYLGCALSPFFAGLTFDYLSSYRFYFIVSAMIVVVETLLIHKIIPERS